MQGSLNKEPDIDELFFLDALITSFKFLRESVTFLYIQAQIKAKDKDVRRMTISINCFKENKKHK